MEKPNQNKVSKTKSNNTEKVKARDSLRLTLAYIYIYIFVDLAHVKSLGAPEIRPTVDRWGLPCRAYGRRFRAIPPCLLQPAIHKISSYLPEFTLSLFRVTTILRDYEQGGLCNKLYNKMVIGFCGKKKNLKLFIKSFDVFRHSN